MQFICYPKCTTCQKAQKWLDAHEIEYDIRHIKEENPSEEELRDWHAKSGLPLKRFFNTSGMLYKEMKLKDKLPEMTEDEQKTSEKSVQDLTDKYIKVVDDVTAKKTKEVMSL